MSHSKHRQFTAKQFGVLPYVIVDDQIMFYVISSRDSGQYIFVKGRPEIHKGKFVKPKKIRIKEAKDEMGARGRVWPKPLGHVLYDKYEKAGGGEGRAARCRRVKLDVSLMRVDKILPEFKEQGQREILLVPPIDALNMICANSNIPRDEDNLLRLAKIFTLAHEKITGSLRAADKRAEAVRPKKAHKKSSFSCGAGRPSNPGVF